MFEGRVDTYHSLVLRSILAKAWQHPELFPTRELASISPYKALQEFDIRAAPLQMVLTLLKSYLSHTFLFLVITMMIGGTYN